MLTANLPVADVGYFRIPSTIFRGTALTYLKPRFKRALRPTASRLAAVGVTANQVTIASLLGSITVAATLCALPGNRLLFALLPTWLLVRMACATIDGTLAVEFGQRSRVGGILNEAGDVISDVALLAPLAFVAPFSSLSILIIAALTAAAEAVGVLSQFLTGIRRLEGPLGKADRSILLAIVATAIALFGPLPDPVALLVPIVAAGLLLTSWNRLRLAIAPPEVGDAMTSTSRYDQSVEFLKGLGDNWAGLIKLVGPCRHDPKAARAPYEALVRAIAYQQLTAKAGDAIIGRLKTLAPASVFPEPKDLIAADFDALRACGFSATKIVTVKAIAEGTLSGLVPNRRAAEQMDDEALVSGLTTIKGIGRWTVEMLLMYSLERLDVFPSDDFGVREGYRALKGLPEQPKPRELRALSEAWSPHRTVASWYLWRVPRERGNVLK